MQTMIVTTADHFPIAVTFFGEANTGPIVLVNSGAGIVQRFYSHLANYLAQQGFTVVTYDYRGIGASRSGPVAGHVGSMKEWAQKDMHAVVEHLHKTYPTRALTAIGHSFGGQAFALHSGNHVFSRVVMVGAQSGYWRLFDGMGKLRALALWYFFAPLLLPFLNYFPSRQFGLGEALPPGVMRQWAAWGRHPNYLMAEFDRGEVNRFHELQCPILMLEISDDSIAPARAVAALRAHLPQRRLFARRLDAKTIAPGGMGHFGFFKESRRASLWAPLAAFLSGQDAQGLNFASAAPADRG